MSASKFGDGTSWSSERGKEPYGPGGTGGSNNGGNNNSWPGVSAAVQKQISSVRSDPTVTEKLKNLLIAVHILNPSAKVKIEDISAAGTLSISVSGINSEQASTIGLSGLILNFKHKSGNVAVGNIETGHKRTKTDTATGSDNAQIMNGVLSNAVEASKPPSTPTIQQRAEKLYGADRVSCKALVNMYKESVAKGSIPAKVKGDLRKKVQMMLDEDKAIAAAAAAKKVDEAALLLKTSDYIVDVGNKISGQLSDRYRVIAKELAGKVKNYQGKNIRSYNDAMKTLSRLNSNPSMRISPADKAVLINAWRQVNAQNMSINLANLSKVFTAAGWLLRVEKVREKSIVGYETGNWGPLILEVESWVLSGVVASVAMATLGIIVSMFAISSLFSSTLIMIVVTLIISYLASLIDDSFAERINNELIKPAR